MTLHRIRKGLDLPLAGAPTQAVEPATAVRRGRTARRGRARACKPSLLVQPGDTRARGTAACTRTAGCPACATRRPATGTVEAMHRGVRRAFVSLVVAVDRNAG